MLKLIILICFISVTGLFSKGIIISEQPVSVVDCEGLPAAISVIAESETGSKILYQWYKDDEIIPGAVSNIFNFPELKYNNSGLYFCRVSDENESIVSKPVTVFALIPVSVNREPEDVLIYGFEGNVFLNFEAHINGHSIDENMNDKSIKIQWYQIIAKKNIQLEDSEIFSGTKTNRLSVNSDNLPDSTFYFSVIEGNCGKDTTKSVKIVKNYNDIEIKLSEIGYKICTCNEHTIKAEIKNPKNYHLGLRWFKNGEPVYSNSNLKGTNSGELNFNPLSKSDEGRYKLEVKVKEINFIGSSNEIKLEIMEKPEIIAVRIDSLTEHLIDEYININFYFKRSDSIAIKMFNDENIFKNHIYTEKYNYFQNRKFVRYLSLVIDKKKINSKYWAIARNKCGVSYSDTVSIQDDLNKFQNRDPWNQFQELCENDSTFFEIFYKLTPSSKLLSTWWAKPNYLDNFIRFIGNDNNIQGTKTNKLKINKIEKKNEGFYQLFIRYYNGIDTVIKYDMSSGFRLYVKPIPNINKQPENIILINKDHDTLFQIEFVKDEKNNIEVSLYYMKNRDSKPELIDKTDYSIVDYYAFTKDITFNDDGYYFALSKHKNDCKPVSSDTIRVTVNPKGIVADINENDINTGMSVYPNPASDFITIQSSEGYNVQIYNTLGIEVISTPLLRDTPQEGKFRIDISALPVGVYYIRIGVRVEKFVKV